MTRFGIRQGRLSPATFGSVPRFPWTSWQDEFTSAQRCGFDQIEWLFSAEGYERNPIWTSEGRHEIVGVVEKTGVRVEAVCGDFFLARPFFRVTDEARAESTRVLERLVEIAAQLRLHTIVVPVLESAEIRAPADAQSLFESLRVPLDLAAAAGLKLALEIDLPAAEIRTLVDRHRHEALAVCYDTGNAAFKGWSVTTDLNVLAPLLCEVHIKDRKRHGPNVPLGNGDVDFSDFFRVADEIGLDLPLILETPVAPSPESAALSNLSFLREAAAGLSGYEGAVQRLDG